MSDVKQRIIFEFEGDQAKRVLENLNRGLDDYSNESKSASAETKKLDGGMKGLVKAFTAANLASQAISKAFGFITNQVGDAVKAAQEYEKTNARLKVALEAAGMPAQKYSEILNEQSSRLEIFTGKSDELIRQLQASAIAYGASADNASAYAKAAIAMENATGTAANEGLKQLTKALSGVAEETLRMTPGITELTNKQLKHGDAVQVVLDQYGRFANLENVGTFGAMNRLKNALSSMAEELVKTITGTDNLEKAINAIAGYVEKLSKYVNIAVAALRVGTTLPLMLFGDRAAATELMQENVARLGELINGPKGSGKPDGKVDFTPGADRSSGKPAGGAGRGIRNASGAGAGSGVLDFGGSSGRISIDTDPTQGIDAFSRAEELKNEIYQSNLDRRNEILEENARRQNEIIQENQSRQAAMMAEAQNVFLEGTSIISSAISEELISVLEGGKFVFDQFFTDMLSNLGRYMITRGTAYLLEGTAMALMGMPNGAAIAALGGNMVAFGAPLVAAGAALDPGQGNAAPSPGSSVGGVSNPGGFSGPRRNESERNTGPEKIIINVEGAVTEAEVGVKVRKALEAARREGL